jgi:predicted flap endonuclease-1-like 5' DNA nuclease
LDAMNPIIIVAGFVVLLALLLYYMYKEKAAVEAPPEKPRREPTVVKVKDYEAQLAAEEPAEAHEAEQPEEPAPQPEEPVPQPEEQEAQTDDLESLSGVGEKFRALLRAAGVRSVVELASEEPAALLERLREANEREDLVKRLPRMEDVEDWVQKAKEQSR